MAISETVGRLSVLTDTVKYLWLRRINRIRTIQGSLAIEGNTLSEEQITAILDGKRVIAPPREILDVRSSQPMTVSNRGDLKWGLSCRMRTVS
ncbi:MAG: hypothetical protein Q8R42_06270 [Desulfocapsaceae bacterium]|nr:hypothetical protein [Desulfocapsaceae bacterium]